MAELTQKETPANDLQPLEDARRQRLRSLVIAVGLGLLVVLFYLATIVRLGGNALNRDI